MHLLIVLLAIGFRRAGRGLRRPWPAGARRRRICRRRKHPGRPGQTERPIRCRIRSCGNDVFCGDGGPAGQDDPIGSPRSHAGRDGARGDGGDGGPAKQAQFNGPHSLAVAGNGDVFVADTWNNRVRKIDGRSGAISMSPGQAAADSRATVAPRRKQNSAEFIALHSNETAAIILADLDNRRVRRVDLETGLVSTVAGNGKKGVPTDGDVARSAPLVDPRAVAVDSKGNLYILERSGHALRVVDRQGRIRTVAGTGEAGGSGDGGDARLASLNGPKHLCVDNRGNVLIADTENHRVRLYRPADERSRP